MRVCDGGWRGSAGASTESKTFRTDACTASVVQLPASAATILKQVTKFTFNNTSNDTSCNTYISLSLSMKVSSLQSAHVRFPSGLVKVSVKRREDRFFHTLEVLRGSDEDGGRRGQETRPLRELQELSY